MIKVVYASRGGNTKKLADAVANGVNSVAVLAEQYDTSVSADLLFVGASVYAGKIDGTLRKFLQGLSSANVKKAAVFGSSAGKKTALNEISAILAPKGISVLSEEFHCKGSFLFAHRGHPDADDLRAAEAFAKEVGSK